jgi:YggT family protein
MRCLAVSDTLTSILCPLLSIYWVILLVRILSSWFPPPRGGPLRAILMFCYRVTEPVLRPLRSLIPAIRAGMMAIDLSPIIVFILIGVVQRAVGCLGFGF